MIEIEPLSAATKLGSRYLAPRSSAGGGPISRYLAHSPQVAGADGNFRGDAAHTGAVSDPRVRPPLHRVWSRPLSTNPSAPVIGEGKVFVTAEGWQPGRSRLIALSARTGRVL